MKDKLKTIFVTTPKTSISISKKALCFIKDTPSNLQGFNNTELKIPFSDFKCLAIIGPHKVAENIISTLLSKDKYIFFISTSGTFPPKVLIPAYTQVKNHFLKIQSYSDQNYDWKQEYLLQELIKMKLDIFYSIKNKFMPMLKKAFPKKTLQKLLNKEMQKLPKLEFLKILDIEILNLLKDHFPTEANFHEIEKVLNFVYALSYAFITVLLVENKIFPFAGLTKTLSKEMLEIAKPLLMVFVFKIFSFGYLEREDFTPLFIKPKAAQVICKLYAEQILGKHVLSAGFPWLREVIKKCSIS